MPSQLFKDVKKGLPPAIKVLEANAGDKLTVDVDVADMTLAYHVAYDGGALLVGFTDQKETIALEGGVHTVGWNFQHTEKKWKHRIRARIGNKAFVTLEEKSEAKKDKPVSVGLAFVVVNDAQPSA